MKLSPRLPYNKQCKGKVRYKTRIKAERVIGKMAKQKKNVHHLVAYPCPHCKGWHLGNRYRRD